MSLRIQRRGIIADDNPSFSKKFVKGQILFGKRRCYQKKAAVPDFEGICSGDIIVIEPRSDRILSGLLPFIIQSEKFFQWAEKTSSGSLSPRTKWKALADFELSLPAIEAQNKILKTLTTANCCKYLYEELLSTCRTTQASFLGAWLLGKHNKKDWQKLGSALCVPPQYGATEAAIAYSAHTYRYIRVTDITDSGTIDEAVKMGAPKDGNNRYCLVDDDFLIARSGNTVGKALLYKEELAPDSIFAGYLIRLKLNNKVLLPEFLKYYCRTPLFWRWLEATARGGAQPNINAQQIAEMELPIPSIIEQEECLIKLHAYEHVADTLSRQLARILNLNKKLLTRLLFAEEVSGL